MEYAVRVTDDRDGLLDVPAVTIAVGRDRPECDLFAPDGETAAWWEHRLARAPRAAAVAAMLVRRGSSLVAESLAYSLLQGGLEFRAWLARRGPAPGVPDAGVPRVRVDDREVVLTRAARHNALDVEMRDALCEVLAALAIDGDPITLRGEGPSFCSGGDLDEFGTAPPPVDAHLVRLARSPADHVARVADRLTTHVHGQTLGSGIELAAFARHVVADLDTRIALPELDLGLIPGAGGTVSIPARIGRRRFCELLFSGDTIDAATALEWGLVDEVRAP